MSSRNEKMMGNQFKYCIQCDNFFLYLFPIESQNITLLHILGIKERGNNNTSLIIMIAHKIPHERLLYNCSLTYVYDFSNNIESLEILYVDYSHLNIALKIRQKQVYFIYTLKAFLILLQISIHLETDNTQKGVNFSIQRDFNDLL